MLFAHDFVLHTVLSQVYFYRLPSFVKCYNASTPPLMELFNARTVLLLHTAVRPAVCLLCFHHLLLGVHLVHLIRQYVYCFILPASRILFLVFSVVLTLRSFSFVAYDRAQTTLLPSLSSSSGYPSRLSNHVVLIVLHLFILAGHILCVILFILLYSACSQFVSAPFLHVLFYF